MIKNSRLTMMAFLTDHTKISQEEESQSIIGISRRATKVRNHSVHLGIHLDYEDIDREFEPRRWQWAYPVIEGVNPCPRGGHSATLSGTSIIIFGGHYYSGKQEGYTYLNDTYVLDVNANKFNVQTHIT